MQRQTPKFPISSDNGITVHCPSYRLSLDPKRANRCDFAFVSHAHIDHVHKPGRKSKIIASKETAELARRRGYDLGNPVQNAPGIEMVDSGHIFGSKALLVNDSIFYTGDIAARDRAFLKGCKGVKCDTLIMETTYGEPQYCFPPIEKIIAWTNEFVSRCFDACRPVVLTGYPLGKAQLISYFFQSWEPLFLHESICAMNKAHFELGVPLKQNQVFNESEQRSLKSSPWVLIAPMFSGKSDFIKGIREKYGAAVVGFSGWAAEPKYARIMNLDAAFPLSDHCDFDELVGVAKYCDPSMIYTVHGFAKEFAAHLRSIGFEACALAEGNDQSKLTSYI